MRFYNITVVYYHNKAVPSALLYGNEHRIILNTISFLVVPCFDCVPTICDDVLFGWFKSSTKHIMFY